jgi:glycosyltransferase involved in cell wall biosynthesis
VNRPTFSVVIPTFNRAALVTEAVRSALDQTIDDHEVVVVDDGSTDGTWEALRPYADRIRYFYQENAGVAAARNRGVAESRGEYLAFLDSDDLFEPRMLEEARRTFECFPDAGAVFTAVVEFDSNVRLFGVINKRTPGRFFTPTGMIGRDTTVGSGRPGIIQRRWVDELGGFDESLGCAVDCDLWIRYSFHMPMVLQPNPLVLRRWHPTNLVSNLQQDAEDWLRILEKVASDHPEFVLQHPRVYRRALAKSHLRYGRELLAQGGSRREARRALFRSARIRLLQTRTYVYLGCSYLVPTSAYRRWRSWELRHLDPDGRKATSSIG